MMLMNIMVISGVRSGGCAAGAVCDLPGERGHAVGHKRTHAVCVASLDRLMLPGRRAIVGRLRFV
jgi:hypothetical protein